MLQNKVEPAMISVTACLTVILYTFGRQISGMVTIPKLVERTSSIGEPGCLDRGIRHPINSSFNTEDCSMHCYCTTGGVASCVSLCPNETSLECPPETKLQEEDEPRNSGGVFCTCRRRFCVPTRVVCKLNTRQKYKVGETFSYENCSKSCRCNENGQISCTPFCSTITCPKGTQSKARGEIALGGCSCEIQECIPVSKKFCRVDGRRFKPGRAFITKDCTRKCRCRKNGILRCVPLCKVERKGPVCGPGRRERKVRDTFARGRCSCSRKICLRDDHYNWTDKVDYTRETQ